MSAIPDNKWNHAIEIVEGFITNECSEGKFYECIEVFTSDELKQHSTLTHFKSILGKKLKGTLKDDQIMTCAILIWEAIQ